MEKIIMHEIKKENELTEIEISQKFLEEYKKLVEKYKRDFETEIKIIKLEKIK